MKSPLSKTLNHALELSVCGGLVVFMAWLLVITGLATAEDLRTVVLGAIGLIITSIVPKYARASGVIADRPNEQYGNHTRANR